MIKNIIFDIGNVLVEYHIGNSIKQFKLEEAKVNKANDILIKSNKWRQYLNGEILDSEILYYFCRKYPHLQQEFNLLLEKEKSKNTLYEIEENTNLLINLSKKYDIYLLSNITKETLENIQEMFEFMRYAKGGVYSYVEHISKPEKEIFRRLLRKYSLNPEESIFIDDRKKNVEIAEELGIKGIHYDNISLGEIIGGVLN